MPHKIIVLVEDSAADARAVSRAIEKLGDATIGLVHHETAENALMYFQNSAHNSDKRIVLMDINFPGTNGLTFLKHLKSTPSLKHIPVIIWTTSDQQQDIDNSYENGANSFITKPMSLSDVTEMVRDVCHYWFKRATIA